MMNEVYIIDAIRTPIGMYAGGLKDVRPDDMAALLIVAIISRIFTNRISPSEIEDVFLGNANGAGEENRNAARMSVHCSLIYL